jgi:hypothetical protein
MHPIEMHEVSDEFAHCCLAAVQHIETRAEGRLRSWLKNNLHHPFLEHLSFRLGNQLFFIRLEDADGLLQLPGSRDGLFTVAAGCKGHPCIMPMQHRAGRWTAQLPGWGLTDPRNGMSIDPIALITDERIEMTEWEVHDCGIQVVRDHLQKAGREVIWWNSAPDLEPSIWFAGDSGPEWVMVRTVRYPAAMPDPPPGWEQIAETCAAIGRVGHFASVSLASADDAFDSSGVVPATPLWRGHRMFPRFDGLVPAPV